jgi:hypothetical protein
MEKDLTLIDGVRIEVGKSYWVKHWPSDGKWEKVNITRITQHGHPWSEGKHRNGIITDSYKIQELTSEVELEQFARTWLQEKGYEAFAHLTPVPEWFANMYNDFRSEL